MEQAGAHVCAAPGSIGNFDSLNEDVFEFRRNWGADTYCYQDRRNSVSMPYACQYGNDF